MKHIELLTMESYLEAKKELLEKANCTFDELHIDDVENIRKNIEEIKELYFEEENECGAQNTPTVKIWKKDGYIEVNATLDVGRYVFLKSLKTRYSQLIKEERTMEIVKEIKKVLSDEFINSCKLPSGQMKRIYEIIKYTLSRERKCDYLDNGKFINKMDEEDIFPFEVVEEKLPIYCQDMQRVLFDAHGTIFSNPNNYRKPIDITRFSFYNVAEIVDAVTKKLTIEGNSMDYKEDRRDYNSGYIEGVEDYVLLNEILGISLTNIIYWKTKEIEEREVQDYIIEIVQHLAKCQYSTGRDSVAQVLFDYLKAVDYNKNIIQEVGEILKKEVWVWNGYYEEVESVVLCPIFSYLKESSENDLIEVCKNIEGKSAWGSYIYMDEIIEDEKKKSENIENEENIWDENVENNEKKGDENVKGGKKKKKDKIRIPKGNMNHRTWYAYIHKTVFDVIWS